MLDRVRLLWLIFLFFACSAKAQDVKVHGQFQVDSIKIGIIFPYALSATYPRNETIVFPDSTFSFDPFEIHHKIYFPTKTVGTFSYDSVVYYLTSFEIDSTQKLSLPIFLVNQRDCTAVFARMDSVFLQQLVKHVPDSVSAEQLPLKTNTTYQAVGWLLNYPLLLIIASVAIIGIIIIWIVFGKRIKRYFILRKLNKNHNIFIHEYEDAVENLQKGYSTHEAEATLLLWKQYMERLLSSPFTKLTTREIFQLLKDEPLSKALKHIDWNIYGEGKEIKTDPLFQLQQYTEQQFHKKVQEVKNG